MMRSCRVRIPLEYPRSWVPKILRLLRNSGHRLSQSIVCRKSLILEGYPEWRLPKMLCLDGVQGIYTASYPTLLRALPCVEYLWCIPRVTTSSFLVPIFLDEFWLLDQLIGWSIVTHWLIPWSIITHSLICWSNPAVVTRSMLLRWNNGNTRSLDQT